MSKSMKKLSLEAAMERLDAIVEAMESGQIGIEESIARYEEAMSLAAQCRQILDQAEQRVRAIQENANGQVQAVRFDAAATDGPAEAPSDGSGSGDD